MVPTLLTLAALALPLQADPPTEDPFWIKLDISERAAVGDRPPAFYYAGTTNLPNGTRLDVEIYYGRYFIGRNLIAKALPVLNGKFFLEMVLYRNSEKNLAGPHLVRTWVYGDQQSPAVRAILGPEPVNRKYEEVYRVGSPEEAKAERHDVYMRMVDYVKTYGALFDEIKEHGKKVKGSFDRPAWKVQQGRWEARALEIERDARKVNEFLALEMDHFVKMHFEDLRDGVSIVANWTAIALEQPNNPAFAQMLQQHRIAQARTMEEILRTADPTWGNAEDILRDLERLREIVRSALASPADDHRAARREFITTLFRVQPHAPERLHHVIVDIAAGLRDFFRALPDDLPVARKLQSSIDAHLESLSKSLKREAEE